MDKIAACTVFMDMIVIVTEQGKMFRVVYDDLHDRLNIIQVELQISLNK